MPSLNNVCVLSVMVILLKLQAGEADKEELKPIIDETYYKNCAPDVTCDPKSPYRLENGSCNNLKNPLWGSGKTPFIRLAPAVFDDGDHEVRKQSNGKDLPGPRQLQVAIFLSKALDTPDSRNFHLTQIGQWVAHDITLMLQDFAAPDDCCAVQNSSAIPYHCKLVINVEPTDPVYSKIGKKCIPFRRVSTTNTVINCTIKPRISLNQATAFIDASQIYGHSFASVESLRNKTGGKMKSEMINGQEFSPQQERGGLKLCLGRDDVNLCFDQGDSRTNQHYGLLIYNAVFIRFHNYLVDELLKLNPSWTDEILFQEARKIVGAVNQILVYRDFLPVLLGEDFATKSGLTLDKDTPTVYCPEIMPQLAVEFVGGCFRVLHNVIPEKFFYLDKDNKVASEEFINEVMNIPDAIVEGTNFEYLLRGMSTKPGRAPISSYNKKLSSFLFHGALPMNADQDLLSIDIQRSRDIGVPPYTVIRELCGLPKIKNFEDLLSVSSEFDVALMKTLYADVSDVDLLVGALLEKVIPGSMVGPTTRCILTDGFHRLRYGDRWFFDVADQPGSFKPEQLEFLWSLDINQIFCGMTTVGEFPEKIVMAEGCSEMVKCEPFKLDLSAWTDD